MILITLNFLSQNLKWSRKIVNQSIYIQTQSLTTLFFIKNLPHKYHFLFFRLYDEICLTFYVTYQTLVSIFLCLECLTNTLSYVKSRIKTKNKCVESFLAISYFEEGNEMLYKCDFIYYRVFLKMYYNTLIFTSSFLSLILF